MKLYFEILKLLFNKLKGKNNGELIKVFAVNMGVVYIKLAQILATQNYGNIFTEQDREELSSICDACNPISFSEIKKILEKEYGALDNVFSYISEVPIGSASVSQVHYGRLKNGEEVAIKVKRKDITKTIEEDIEKIRKIVHKFGWLAQFKNFVGSDHALELYLTWIKEETDFVHEVQNIKAYQSFANDVNGQIKGLKEIRIPKVYDEYCTPNVIVMEYINNLTINKIELNDENKKIILEALNSYLKLSFWALFHDKPVVFHADPHVGNLVIDDNNDLCFLDMGLLCILNSKDAKLCREFFLTAYSGNYEKLYNMLVIYGDLSIKDKERFKIDCKKYCEEAKSKDVTHYFIDMINVFTKYELNPPTFLFYMAKAFICLNGLSHLIDNDGTALGLLEEQTLEFMLNRSFRDIKTIAKDTINIAPDFLKDSLEVGSIGALAKVMSDENMRSDIRVSLENFQEMLSLLKIASEKPLVRARRQNIEK